jgi:hypothetical protein
MTEQQTTSVTQNASYKLKLPQQVNRFSALYGTQTFIT